MNEYTVIQQSELGKKIWFVLRNGKVFVSRHNSLEAAWSAAQAKAQEDAARYGGTAVYTTAEIITDIHQGVSPRPCWKVQSDSQPAPPRT